MSPSPSRPTAARSAAAVNEAIRELMEEAARQRIRVDADQYHRLVVEYAEAVQAEAELAA